MVEAFLFDSKVASTGILVLSIALGLGACAGPVTLYHNIEGGTIAQVRQPPPGADAPYPNLASVPAAPAAVTPAEQNAVTSRLAINSPQIAATQANPAAWAGLALPSGPPPVPDVPGLSLPAVPTPNVLPAPAPPPPAAKPVQSAPVSIAFAPHSAILSPDMITALTAIAPARGNSRVLAAGFGDAKAGPDQASLSLALARARAIADQLTAAGVPAKAIILDAAAAGSGGFVQLVY